MSIGAELVGCHPFPPNHLHTLPHVHTSLITFGHVTTDGGYPSAPPLLPLHVNNISLIALTIWRHLETVISSFFNCYAGKIKPIDLKLGTRFPSNPLYTMLAVGMSLIALGRFEGIGHTF